MNPIIVAAKFAARAHAGQTRKWTGAPYITHPARVASRAMLSPIATEDMICAAWLHDTIEDCQVTESQLEEMFGRKVASLVYWLTSPTKGSKAPRAERKLADREFLRAAPQRAKQIKLLDRIDNLRELPCTAETVRFCEIYADESEALLEVLASASQPLAGELHDTILELRKQVQHFKSEIVAGGVP